MLSVSHSGRSWEYFITMLKECSFTINQMCWPVIIASALSQGSRDFTCALPFIAHWSTSPCVLWKTSEQKSECQYNWCICSSRRTPLTSCKLLPCCNSRTKGLTHWYVSKVWGTLSAAVKGNRWLMIFCWDNTLLMILRCMCFSFQCDFAICALFIIAFLLPCGFVT